MTFDPLNDTHVPSKKWLNMSNSLRLAEVSKILSNNELGINIEVIGATKNGQITLKIEEAIASNIRGLFLLGLEKTLKKEVDVGLTLWLIPVGDKSKLRALRGVKIKD